MTFKWIILALVAPLISAERVQFIDLTPEEAQKLITQQSLDLRYAKKLSDGPAVGRSYNGKIIDSNDYTEEIYEANQFHGQANMNKTINFNLLRFNEEILPQDGLGRAIFGYTDNQQSRLEARNANGEVRGQYQYIDPWGKDIQVQYWVDSLGFHQTDNHPKYDLQPVTETPEVKQARKEHERLWKAAARLNGDDLDSNDLYNPNAERLESNNYDDYEELEGQVSNQHQSLARYPVLPYSQHIAPENARQFGKVVDDSVIVESLVDSNNLRSRFARQQENIEEEVTSEPRGFFYKFDYPVPFIVGRNTRSKRMPETHSSDNAKASVDERVNSYAVPIEKKQVETVMQSQRVSQNIFEGVLSGDEVHDTQTSPKHKVVPVKQNVAVDGAKSQNAQTKIKEKVNRGRGSVKFSIPTK